MRRILAACALTALAAAAPERSHVVVYPLMKGGIAAHASDLWEVTNRAAAGAADAGTLTPADWRKLARAARGLQRAAAELASAERIDVVQPGAALPDAPDADAPSLADIQRTIDRDPPGFAAHARQLGTVAGAFRRAAAQRDAAQLAAAGRALDGACEACHLAFWYPERAGSRASGRMP